MSISELLAAPSGLLGDSKAALENTLCREPRELLPWLTRNQRAGGVLGRGIAVKPGELR
ncbi:MAG: hypothetical protein WCI18_10125 [Pseudomonadota bacterium]